MNDAVSAYQIRRYVVAPMMNWFLRHRIAAAYLIAALSWSPLLSCLDSGAEQGDVKIYKSDSIAVLSGRLPYRDTVVEYPPYAILIFLLPRAFSGENYVGWFMMLAVLCDLGIRAELFLASLRQSNLWRSLLPMLCYCAALPFLRFFLFQRFDLWPALLTLSGLLLFGSGSLVWAGLLVAIGIGMKVYPVVFVPPLFILALRQRAAKRFMVGLITGLLPLLGLAFVIPWWRFAQFQGNRGLQCESLAASLIWAAKHLALTDAKWVWVTRWFEVQGPLASTLLPWARGLFVVGVLSSVTVASMAATRFGRIGIGRLARLLLIPLLAFVAFNQVLSPQFMIWLLPMAALATLEGNPWTVLGIPLATMLTPVIFPSLTGNYGSGLNSIETVVLVTRNSILVAVWALLLREHWRLWRHASEPEPRRGEATVRADS